MLWVLLLAELWAMWSDNKTLGRLLAVLQVNKLCSNVRSPTSLDLQLRISQNTGALAGASAGANVGNNLGSGLNNLVHGLGGRWNNGYGYNNGYYGGYYGGHGHHGHHYGR